MRGDHAPGFPFIEEGHEARAEGSGDDAHALRAVASARSRGPRAALEKYISPRRLSPPLPDATGFGTNRDLTGDAP